MRIFGIAPAGWSLALLATNQGQGQRTCVREHMGRVGQERERVRHDSNDNLEGHEPDNQQQRDCQIPTVRVRAHAVRVAANPVLVIGVIVTMLAHLSDIRLWRHGSVGGDLN